MAEDWQGKRQVAGCKLLLNRHGRRQGLSRHAVLCRHLSCTSWGEVSLPAAAGVLRRQSDIGLADLLACLQSHSTADAVYSSPSCSALAAIVPLHLDTMPPHMPAACAVASSGTQGFSCPIYLVHEAPEELIVTLESLHKALRRKHPQTLPVRGHLQAPPPLSVLGLGLSLRCAGTEHTDIQVGRMRCAQSCRLLPDVHCCRWMPGVQHQFWQYWGHACPSPEQCVQ